MLAIDQGLAPIYWTPQRRLGGSALIVLDTHTLVWWVNGDATLTKKVRAAIDGECDGGQIIVFAISAWEITMLVDRGKLVLSMDVESWLATVLGIDGMQFWPVDVEISTKSIRLPGNFHKNPANSVIVATARKLAVPLVTKDDKIRNYAHVKTIW